MGVISKAFDDAAHAKTCAIRLRSDNPAADVRGPDRGERTLKQYLYPSEFLDFVTSEDVPLAWRRVVALAMYPYLRLGELEALEWEDIDLERGTIHIHRAINREDGEVKATKTDTPRNLRATGITWRAVRGDDPLKIMASAGHRNFATTQGYIREAEPIREGFGAVFPIFDGSSFFTPESLRKFENATKTSAEGGT